MAMNLYDKINLASQIQSLLPINLQGEEYFGKLLESVTETEFCKFSEFKNRIDMIDKDEVLYFMCGIYRKMLNQIFLKNAQDEYPESNLENSQNDHQENRHEKINARVAYWTNHCVYYNTILINENVRNWINDMRSFTMKK